MSIQTAGADPAANQLPSGGSVAAGAAGISVSGSKMQIDQASDKAIINWQNFSIGKDGWVNFSQPSSSSVALNRSMQPAEIFGRLSANGQVFITSQAGVYFARTAQVDVNGLVATNLSIRDQDFMAGRYVFSNDGSSGSVVNDGTIITPGGYAALAGTQVRNNGVIVAQAGTVALAAGERVTLDMVGDGLIKVNVDAAALNALALNSGTIQADGGRVVLTARSANALLDTVINNTGIIRARSLVERNGEIVLDGGGAGVVANGGSIDAAGTTGTRGGSVQVTGQYVALTGGSSIDASGDAGGGTVTVKAVDAAFVYGTISARDTGGNGKGGTVETSGNYVEVTQAPGVGAGGTWLIDPYDIEVVAEVPPPGFSNNTGPTSFTPNGDTSRIAASLITNQLNDGTNVVLDTGGLGSPGMQPGDIRVQAAIDKTVANPASLTLKAFHDVQVNQPISIASAFGPTGFGTLTIEAGNNVVVTAPITTPGGGLSVRAGGFTNYSAINNGVGVDLKPGMAIVADRFDLGGGTINGGQGSVGLFTRTATNSLGVESAGDTRITNADIASITTSPNSPSTNANQLLIGVGSLGAMTIGADAQVDGGSKNLVFSAPGGSGTRITIGANGLTTTGDVAVNAGGGSIGGTGTIGGNRVQLTANTGIGTQTARVGTAVGTLAARTTNGSVFIAEADNVILGAVLLAGQTVTNGVAPGNAYDLTAGGNVAVAGVVNVGGRLNLGAGGSLSVNAAGGADSQLISSGGQTITAQAVAMNAQDGGRTVIQNNGTGNQSLTIGAGGINMNVVGGSGVAQIAQNAPAAQTVSTAGSLTVIGGSAAPSTGSGLFQNPNGKQTVTAASIVLQAAMAGNSGGAFISNAGAPGTPPPANAGDQEINVAGGTISIAGGAVGLGNRAGIVTLGNQTINGNPDITVTGGTSGNGTALANTSNGVFINSNGAGKLQTINAGTITVTAGSGGNDTFAIISAPNQVITATGDVLVRGGAGTGDANTARIGGLGGTAGATNLTLEARDVILTGGATNGAGLGSTPIGSAQPNTITVTAGRDVLLNASDGAGVRIGTALNFATPATGDISVAAGRDIQLNGTATQVAAIRTTGKVTLSTSGSDGISEGSNGFVQAGSLSTFSSNGPTNLSGPNQVGTLDAMTMGGDLTFNNTGTLNLRSVMLTGNLLAPGNGSITNNGDVIVTGFVNANGALTVNVAGALKLDADATHDATVFSNGQTINAQSLLVRSRDNRPAALNNNSGDQVISIAGGSVDVENLNLGGVAQIGSFGPGANQSLTVTNGDHINVNGGVANTNGNQTVSITGSGANRISAGSAGTPRGSVFVAGRNQTITAGTGAESGSITIVGPAAAGTGISGFVTSAGVGVDTQTVSTTGTLRVSGGTAPVQAANSNSGIFHNRQGQQSITAADIVVEGGPSGSNNGAFISNGNGVGLQEIFVTGTIGLTAGAVGQGNRAFIITNGNQWIHGDPDLVLTGGIGGGGSAAANTSNGAGIVVNVAGKQQTINAASITLAGGGGNDAFAIISAPNQVITASGDVLLTGGSGTGTPIARIGGGGQPGGGTTLALSARDIVLTGGSAAGGDAGIGATVSGGSPLSGTININTARDVILNSGTAANARIGTSLNFATPAAGDITVVAGRDIQLNGTTNAAAIRTAGNVVLTAGGTISEAANGFVVATTLDTTSAGAQNLVGPNQVSRFTAEAASGDVTLRNIASVLTLGTMDLSGSLSIDQTGALAVPGTVSALNQSIQATGEVTIGGAGGLAPSGLFAPGTIGISTPQSIVLRGSDIASGGSSTVSAGGLVTLNAGDLILTGGAAQLAGTNVLGGELVVTTGHNIALTSGTGWNANTLLYSTNNITMTVGGLLTLNGGHSVDNWVKVQTQRYDGTITLNFPNAASGSVSVDGFVGKFKHGEDGFFTADKPAKLGDTLLINYGL